MAQSVKFRDPRVHRKIDRLRACPKCHRDQDVCLCAKAPVFENRIPVIILQHPQEQYKELNSAWLAHIMLKNSDVRVGLSWNGFKSVAGESAMPSQWGILFLDSKGNASDPPVAILDRKKQRITDSGFLKGIIALDGSWKQAKTLWWRNPWFLKLNRISLNPAHASLRAQTREGGLSTIEAIAFALDNLGEDKKIGESLRENFRRLIVER
ncbi:MAG: DTW domain-containing protein [Deltaproteobacteria bacterium]